MPATRLRIFISSVQKEFATLRHDLKAFLLGDAFLRRFVAEVFLFEELPASDQRADQVYLVEVERCDIYLGIFGCALLLFGSAPQRFHRTAETKCVSCHGTQYGRPFASQQIYGGDLFEQADQARDFVLAKINRAVGTRAASITAPATYDLPPDAVGEAVVNAIAHRDYHSHASVEVRLFADRLEVWNPGTLPGTLTLDDLRHDHPSVPNNPLIAESLYLTRYIEKAGSGTQRMIELCREAGLPAPDFELRQGSFVLTLWRDWLTDEAMAGLNLNERQFLAVRHTKINREITNADYQRLAGVPHRTAARDLMGLVRLGVFEHHGKGPGAFYAIARNRAMKVPNVPASAPDQPAEKRAKNVPIVPSDGPEDSSKGNAS